MRMHGPEKYKEGTKAQINDVVLVSTVSPVYKVHGFKGIQVMDHPYMTSAKKF